MADWLTTLESFVTSPEGRWAIIGLVVILVFLLILQKFLKYWSRSQSNIADSALLEDLATYAPAPPMPADAKPLVLYGLPVRIRLIVLGPLGNEAGTIEPDEVASIVDRIVPGMYARVMQDATRIRLWPTQLSYSGFIASFRRLSQLPFDADRQQRWVLVMGKVIRNGAPIAVGLALQSTEPHTLGPVMLQHAHQWMEVMRFGS